MSVDARRAVRLLAPIAVVGGVVLCGWGPAQAAEPEPTITLIAAVDPTADLFPGGVGAAQFTIDNPGAAVQLISVSFGDISSSDPARCSADYLTPVNRTLPLSVRVPEHAQALAQSVPGALRLSEGAPDTCQGVTFTVDTTVTGVAQGGTGLPDTGVNAAALTITAGALIAAGVGLARVRRRRA